ncbi:MAG: hypothetical protein R3F60_14310 [bacterium]
MVFSLGRTVKGIMEEHLLTSQLLLAIHATEVSQALPMGAGTLRLER